jgi:hypothetical protein
VNISAAEELGALAYVKNYFIKNGVTIVFCPEIKMFATFLDLPPKQVAGNVDKNVWNSQLMLIVSNLSRNDPKQQDSPSFARLRQPCHESSIFNCLI